MEEILVGLTNGKTSFWDPNTRTYLTLAEKTKKITFNEASEDIGKELERICHGLFAANPSLILYEGKIPEKAMNHWKNKFNFAGLNIAKDRADRLQAKSAETVTAAPLKAKAKPLEEAVVISEPVVEEAVEEAEKTSKARTRNKTTDK